MLAATVASYGRQLPLLRSFLATSHTHKDDEAKASSFIAWLPLKVPRLSHGQPCERVSERLQ
jgi:hypothetical protein